MRRNRRKDTHGRGQSDESAGVTYQSTEEAASKSSASSPERLARTVANASFVLLSNCHSPFQHQHRLSNLLLGLRAVGPAARIRTRKPRTSNAIVLPERADIVIASVEVFEGKTVNGEPFPKTPAPELFSPTLLEPSVIAPIEIARHRHGVLRTLESYRLVITLQESISPLAPSATVNMRAQSGGNSTRRDLLAGHSSFVHQVLIFQTKTKLEESRQQRAIPQW